MSESVDFPDLEFDPKLLELFEDEHLLSEAQQRLITIVEQLSINEGGTTPDVLSWGVLDVWPGRHLRAEVILIDDTMDESNTGDEMQLFVLSMTDRKGVEIDNIAVRKDVGETQRLMESETIEAYGEGGLPDDAIHSFFDRHGLQRFYATW